MASAWRVFIGRASSHASVAGRKPERGQRRRWPAGTHGRHRDPHAQPVAGVVGQARTVLHALVHVVDIERDRSAELALDRHHAAIAARRRCRRRWIVFLRPECALDLADHAGNALGGRLLRGDELAVALLLHARGRERLVHRIHPQYLRVVDAHVFDRMTVSCASDAASTSNGERGERCKAAGAAREAAVIGPEVYALAGGKA